MYHGNWGEGPAIVSLFHQPLPRLCADLPLDQPADDRRLGAAMQGADAIADLGVGLGHALIVPDIFYPGGTFVAFDPQLGATQIAQQRPLARAVTPADPPALGHCAEECEHVLVA